MSLGKTHLSDINVTFLGGGLKICASKCPSRTSHQGIVQVKIHILFHNVGDFLCMWRTFKKGISSFHTSI